MASRASAIGTRAVPGSAAADGSIASRIRIAVAVPYRDILFCLDGNVARAMPADGDADAPQADDFAKRLGFAASVSIPKFAHLCGTF
jgi:hypothetical protein